MIGHSKLNIAIISVFLVSLSILALQTQLSVKEAFAQQQQDNNWYVGEGVTKDMYVKYRISHFDVNNGREFTMLIYFKDQDDKGNWIAPVWVEDQGNVLNGTFILSSLDLSALGTSQIPPEMGKYRSAYANSLQWLAAYVPKPGLSLTAGSWGKIASIGGPEIKPAGQQQLNIPAFPEPVDTTRIEYYKSVSSNMYILNGFPYPVMAKTYVDVTTGSPPIQFQYILTETGKGEPEPPQSSIMELTPPLLQRTERGDYYIQLDWNPATITAGSGEATTFTIDVLDKDQFPVNQASYDFTVTDADSETPIVDLKNQRAREGTNSHTVTFEEPGIVNVKVRINSVQGIGTGMFIEEAQFKVPVK
jgi:hypothetical protein